MSQLRYFAPLRILAVVFGAMGLYFSGQPGPFGFGLVGGIIFLFCAPVLWLFDAVLQPFWKKRAVFWIAQISLSAPVMYVLWRLFRLWNG